MTTPAAAIARHSGRVTGDRLFCVYNADSEEKIREHARMGGFPCDEIVQVAGIIDPVTGED